MTGPVRKSALVALLASAFAVPAALAAGGEPQHRFTKADQAKARKASLRLSDFAAGWTAKPDSSNSTANPKCKTYDPDQSDLIETGKYNSPDFSHSNGSFVSTTTGVFKTVAMAKTGYARVATPQLPKCFGELLGKQAKTTVYAAGPLTFPKVGERSNAYRLSVGIVAQGVTVKATIDFVLFNKGRTDVAIIFFGVGGPLPSRLEQQASALVASRA
jgi:hypothetical protein